MNGFEETSGRVREVPRLTLTEVKDHLLAQLVSCTADQVRHYAWAYEAICRAEDLARSTERPVSGEPGLGDAYWRERQAELVRNPRESD